MTRVSDGSGASEPVSESEIAALRDAPLTPYVSIVSDNSRWEGFSFRPGDIVISTPPKCGTTWTQMLVALLIFDGPDFPEPLGEMSPWLDMCNRPVEEVIAELDAQNHRRFVKTHTPLDGVPYHEEVTYLMVGRDPRDVAISFEHHMQNWDLERFLQIRAENVGFDGLGELTPPPEIPEDPSERFRLFMHGDSELGPPNLKVVMHHFAVGWDRRRLPNVDLLHYGDLKADLPREMMRLGEILDIRVERARVEELAAEASLEAMRDRAEESAERMAAIGWKDPKTFFRTGGSGEWRDRLTDDDLAAYKKRVAELVPPDLAAWAHHGSL